VTPFPSDVGVAIVAHDNRDKLSATIVSLESSGCRHSSILVVDVASTDGTGDWLRAAYPDITVRRLERNEGPNPGRNLGILETGQPYVFLMDGDVVVAPECVQRLRAAMAEDARVKIGSAIVVHANNPQVIQYAGGSLHFICEAINPWKDKTLAERGTSPADVGVASANGLLLDRDAAMAVGLFDERYFLGKDDGDFTHRICLAGYRIREVPDALVLHHSRPRGDWLFYYQIRNRWHFMLKNYQWRTLLIILPCLLVHEPLQLLVLHAQGHGRVYWKAVRGLLAMLPALPKDRALISRIRRVPDTGLLRSDRLIIREDLSKNALVRLGRGLYEGFLTGYWRLLTRTTPTQ
jgi:GT2 family glycosyltransferase